VPETVKCEMDMYIDGDNLISGNITFPRTTTFSNVYAEFGGQNITADLQIAGPVNYDTWFYRWAVSIKRGIDCSKKAAFTLKMDIGTTPFAVCNNKNICKTL
ncbi:Hypothetical predicted protein, partial [Mytilus galloprovincialis]